MKRKASYKILSLILMLTLSLSMVSNAFAQPINEDNLQLKFENYTTEEGYFENGSYVLNGILYEYEEFNSLNGDIFLDVYQVENSKSLENNRTLTQSLYLNAEEKTLYNKGISIAEITSDNNSEATTYDIHTSVYHGSTLFTDIQKYTAEALAISIIASSFTGGVSIGVSVVLSVAVTLLENFFGDFNLAYDRYSTVETFPPDKPGFSVRISSYCEYFNQDDGTSVGTSKTVVQELV